MHERPPATIVDIDDELRSALEDALRGHGQAVIATREDESRSGEGTSDILFELPSDLALLEPVTDYLTKRIEQAWSVPVDRCMSLALGDLRLQLAPFLSRLTALLVSTRLRGSACRRAVLPDRATRSTLAM